MPLHVLNPSGFRRSGKQTLFSAVCLDEIAKIRNQTRDLLASFNDDDLERVISSERRAKSTIILCDGFCII